MAKEIGDQVAVIELLNEGAGFRGSDWATTIRNFFGNAYEAVREAAGDDVKVMIGDAFLGVNVSPSDRLKRCVSLTSRGYPRAGLIS